METEGKKKTSCGIYTFSCIFMWILNLNLSLFKNILFCIIHFHKMGFCLFYLFKNQDMTYFEFPASIAVHIFTTGIVWLFIRFKLIKLDSSDAARRSDDNCINTAKHNSALNVSSAVHFNLNPELLWRDRVFRRTPSSSSGTSPPT